MRLLIDHRLVNISRYQSLTPSPDKDQQLAGRSTSKDLKVTISSVRQTIKKAIIKKLVTFIGVDLSFAFPIIDFYRLETLSEEPRELL